MLCINLHWDDSCRWMMLVLSSFFKQCCIFHLVAGLKLRRRMFLRDWHRRICPGIFQGNILLSQTRKNVLMTFDIHCIGVPSGFCCCVCMGTDPDRGHQGKKKSSENSLLFCEVISSHLVLCSKVHSFPNAGGVAAQGG